VASKYNILQGAIGRLTQLPAHPIQTLNHAGPGESQIFAEPIRSKLLSMAIDPASLKLQPYCNLLNGYQIHKFSSLSPYADPIAGSVAAYAALSVSFVSLKACNQKQIKGMREWSEADVFAEFHMWNDFRTVFASAIVDPCFGQSEKFRKIANAQESHVYSPAKKCLRHTEKPGEKRRAMSARAPIK
jgi:hypothetical protein